MSPRFVRNLSGAVALTGLTLVLACGGTDSSKPVGPEPVVRPTTPVVTPIAGNAAVTKHKYFLTVNSQDPNDKPIVYTATSGNTGRPLVEIGVGRYEYEPTTVPGSSYETITFTATNIDGVASSPARYDIKVAENKAPSLPASMLPHVTIVAGDPKDAVISGLPTVDPDGDDVVWRYIGGGTFETAGGAPPRIQGSNLLLNARTLLPGDYTVELEAEEINNGKHHHAGSGYDTE